VKAEGKVRQTKSQLKAVGYNNYYNTPHWHTKDIFALCFGRFSQTDFATSVAQ